MAEVIIEMIFMLIYFSILFKLFKSEKLIFDYIKLSQNKLLEPVYQPLEAF